MGMSVNGQISLSPYVGIIQIRFQVEIASISSQHAAAAPFFSWGFLALESYLSHFGLYCQAVNG